jgi:hypothetical protein
LDKRSAALSDYCRRVNGEDKEFLLKMAEKCALRGEASAVRPALRSIAGWRLEYGDQNASNCYSVAGVSLWCLFVPLH